MFRAVRCVLLLFYYFLFYLELCSCMNVVCSILSFIIIFKFIEISEALCVFCEESCVFLYWL